MKIVVGVVVYKRVENGPDAKWVADEAAPFGEPFKIVYNHNLAEVPKKQKSKRQPKRKIRPALRAYVSARIASGTRIEQLLGAWGACKCGARNTSTITTPDGNMTYWCGECRNVSPFAEFLGVRGTEMNLVTKAKKKPVVMEPIEPIKQEEEQF